MTRIVSLEHHMQSILDLQSMFWVLTLVKTGNAFFPLVEQEGRTKPPDQDQPPVLQLEPPLALPRGAPAMNRPHGASPRALPPPLWEHFTPLPLSSYNQGTARHVRDYLPKNMPKVLILTLWSQILVEMIQTYGNPSPLILLWNQQQYVSNIQSIIKSHCEFKVKWVKNLNSCQAEAVPETQLLYRGEFHHHHQLLITFNDYYCSKYQLWDLTDF